MNTAIADEFARNGYVILREFLPEATAHALKDMAAADKVMADNAYERTDADGRKSKVTLWYEPGEDVFGRLSCSDRMIAQIGDCLGGAACFFHAKLMQKEARSGGAWEWHQDYGYWYDDGFLSADMASCYVALDPAVRENGCLMVMPGTHKYGRIRHGTVGEQVGADMARVEMLQARHETVYVELAAGDAVIFHANLLHSSNPNLSERSRWGLISSFFRADNESVLDDPRFRRKAIAPIPHGEILSGARASDPDKAFLSVS